MWLLVFVAFVSLVPAKAFAVAGTVSFTPNGGTVVNGSEFTVTVRGNVPDPGFIWGGGATIRVTYDATKLQLVSADDAGGAFSDNDEQEWNNSAGVVRYRAQIYVNAPGVSNQKIISAKFKAIGVGSVTLSFAPETNVNNGPTTGTSSTFTIEQQSCPSGQIGTPPNCSTPPAPPSPKPSSKPPTAAPPQTPKPLPSETPISSPLPDPIEEVPEPISDSEGGLKIDNVITSISRQKNIITWSLNQPDIKQTLVYGTTKSNQKNKAEIRTLTDGNYEATLTDIDPGKRYYFTIQASAQNLLKGAEYSGTFASRGYPVQLTIKQNGVLAPNATVMIGERKFTADKNATITAEFGDGSYDAIVTPSGSTESHRSSFVVKKVPIPNTGEPELQNIIVNAVIENGESSTNDDPLPWIIGGISLLLGGTGLLCIWLYRLRKNNLQQAAVAVDTDLLMTNYGNALSNTRVQTPVPNLDVQAATISATPEQAYSTQEIPQAITGSDSNDLHSKADTPPADTVADLPTDTPLTSTDTPMSVDGFNQLETSDWPQPQPVAEPISSPATEAIPPEEHFAQANHEEAVYHPETGELDIIHTSHHDATPSPLLSSESSAPPATLPIDEPTIRNDTDTTSHPQELPA